jgi:hypothetical protein
MIYKAAHREFSVSGGSAACKAAPLFKPLGCVLELAAQIFA